MPEMRTEDAHAFHDHGAKGRMPHPRSSQPPLTLANGSTRTRPNVGTDGVRDRRRVAEHTTRPRHGERTPPSSGHGCARSTPPQPCDGASGCLMDQKRLARRRPEGLDTGESSTVSYPLARLLRNSGVLLRAPLGRAAQPLPPSRASCASSAAAARGALHATASGALAHGPLLDPLTRRFPLGERRDCSAGNSHYSSSKSSWAVSRCSQRVRGAQIVSGSA
jgi:hypothetical protein